MTQQKLHTFNIDEMIAREDDPKARAYLIILSSVHHAMLANTSATLEVKRSLDEHLTNFEKQTEEHRALMNQGRGAARVVAWVLGVVQIIGLAIWVEAKADLKGIHDALTAAQAVDIRANAKLDEHETRLKTLEAKQ